MMTYLTKSGSGNTAKGVKISQLIVLFLLLFHDTFSQKNIIDTNLVIVNAGVLNRSDLGRLLNIINKQRPLVVGVRFVFSKKMQDDSLFLFSIKEIENLVTQKLMYLNDSGEVKYKRNYFDFGESATNSFYSDISGKNVGGYVLVQNLKTEKGERINDTTFVGKIISLYNPYLFKKIKDKSRSRVLKIYGNKDDFICLEGEKLLKEDEEFKILKNKIVLIGYLSSNDEYSTNMSLPEDTFSISKIIMDSNKGNTMQGLIIDANIIHELLNQ